MTRILTNEATGTAHLLLAHGAGAAMDSSFMEHFADATSSHPGSLTVHRFEFAYMAGRREGRPKRPPPKMDVLAAEYVNSIATLKASIPGDAPLLIGGKSMGGRVASLIADEEFTAGRIVGLVCLGYPFHPQGKPDQLRTEHLSGLQCPTLILQGERDAFGNREEVTDYKLSSAITLNWLTDGDHDFGPRGRSGATKRGNIQEAARFTSAFAAQLTASSSNSGH